MISQLVSRSLKRLSGSDPSIRLFGQPKTQTLPRAVFDSPTETENTSGERSPDYTGLTTQNTIPKHPTDYTGSFAALDMANDENAVSHGPAAHGKNALDDEEHSNDSSHDSGYESHQSCCHEHNPIRSPRAYVLESIHSAMGYYLSFENLVCVRRGLDKSKTHFLRRLSLKDSRESVGGTRYDLVSEVFFHEGTFYQRQQIRCLFHESNKESESETFTGCPHQSLKISKPSWSTKSGLIKVQLDITTNYPQRCVYHAKQRWNSLQGRHSQIEACKLCFSDAELKLQMNGDYLEVEYTCYRDLGAGEDANDPKWRSLLGGDQSCISRPEANKLLLYAKVWRVAESYSRPRAEEAAYKTLSEMLQTVINEMSDDDTLDVNGSGDNESDGDDDPGDHDSGEDSIFLS